MHTFRPALTLGAAALAVAAATLTPAFGGGGSGLTLTVSWDGEGRALPLGSQHRVLITLADVPGESSLRDFSVTLTSDPDPADPALRRLLRTYDAALAGLGLDDPPVLCTGPAPGDGRIAPRDVALEPGQSVQCSTTVTALPGPHVLTMAASALVPGDPHPVARMRMLRYTGLMPPPPHHASALPPISGGGAGHRPGSDAPARPADPPVSLPVPVATVPGGAFPGGAVPGGGVPGGAVPGGAAPVGTIPGGVAPGSPPLSGGSTGALPPLPGLPHLPHLPGLAHVPVAEPGPGRLPHLPASPGGEQGGPAAGGVPGSVSQGAPVPSRTPSADIADPGASGPSPSPAPIPDVVANSDPNVSASGHACLPGASTGPGIADCPCPPTGGPGTGSESTGVCPCPPGTAPTAACPCPPGAAPTPTPACPCPPTPAPAAANLTAIAHCPHPTDRPTPAAARLPAPDTRVADQSRPHAGNQSGVFTIGGLAFTGTAVFFLAVAALGGLAVGTVLILTIRRRRTG